jgi:hypothetical protein
VEFAVPDAAHEARRGVCVEGFQGLQASFQRGEREARFMVRREAVDLDYIGAVKPHVTGLTSVLPARLNNYRNAP